MKYIVIHHWDKLSNKPTFMGTVNWLLQRKSGVSAHYVVEAGKVACLVDPKNIAWHAGNFTANSDSIGIELNPRASEADYLTVAELITELRETYGDLPLKRHSDIVPTACPGKWNLAKIESYIKHGKPPKRLVKPKNSVKKYPNKTLPSSGKHTTDSHNAWVYLMRYAVGRTDKSLTINIQRWLRDLGYYTGKVDGVFGPVTVRAMQTFLRNKKLYRGVIDGVRGSMTINAEISYLNAQRKYLV